MQTGVYAAAVMTVKTERLLVAVLAIVWMLFSVQPVILRPHLAVVECYPTRFVAAVTILYRHGFVALMRSERPGSDSETQENNKQDD